MIPREMTNKGYARSPWAPGYEKFWRAIRCIMGDVQVAYGIEKRDGNWTELTFAKTSGSVTGDETTKIGQ